MKLGIGFSIFSSIILGGAFVYIFALFQSGLFEAYLLFSVDYFGITEPELIPSTNGASETTGTLVGIQIVGLMSAGVVFIMLRSLVGSALPGTQNSSTVERISADFLSAAKEIAFVAVPLTTVLIITTTWIALWSFSENIIGNTVAVQSIIQVVVVYPLLTFYEIAVSEISMPQS
jgi:hypothetical protein